MVVLTLVPVGINKGSLAPPLEVPIYRDVSLGMFKCSPSDSDVELGFRTTALCCLWKRVLWTIGFQISLNIGDPYLKTSILFGTSSGFPVLWLEQDVASRCLVTPCSPLSLVLVGWLWYMIWVARSSEPRRECFLLPVLLMHKQFILVIVLIWGRWLFTVGICPGGSGSVGVQGAQRALGESVFWSQSCSVAGSRLLLKLSWIGGRAEVGQGEGGPGSSGRARTLTMGNRVFHRDRPT